MPPPSPQDVVGRACGHAHRGGRIRLGPARWQVVVFTKHFARGLTLSTSIFFLRFLAHFGLQPHHLSAKAVLHLATFVALCEGYFGIETREDLLRRLFYFKQLMVLNKATNVKEIIACGAALVDHRTGAGFVKLPLQDLVKSWQKEFFYVKNIDHASDLINLPDFINTPQVAMQNWKYALPYLIDVVDQICTRLAQLAEKEGLTRVDLLAIMVPRPVQPLQHRPHLICQMGDRRDPCRLSMKELRLVHVASQVNLISAAQMDEGEWQWGKAPTIRSIRHE
ncbi:hypothetical protein D1007_03930 [Hordeum vulgare]|nr:hypothetical protein D1007_03930 [Hordeum vulgare]